MTMPMTSVPRNSSLTAFLRSCCWYFALGLRTLIPFLWFGCSFLVRSNHMGFPDLRTSKKIRSCVANQYPGENISLLMADYLKDAQELDKDGQYDHSLTRSMLLELLAFIGTGGVGPTGELFCKPFLDHFTTLETALLRIPFLDKTTTDTILHNSDLFCRPVQVRP